jgi:hypothetical protein
LVPPKSLVAEQQPCHSEGSLVATIRKPNPGSRPRFAAREAHQ